MFKRIVNKEVQSIVSEVGRKFKLYVESEFIDIIRDHDVRIKSRQLCDTIEFTTIERIGGSRATRILGKNTCGIAYNFIITVLV